MIIRGLEKTELLESLLRFLPGDNAKRWPYQENPNAEINPSLLRGVLHRIHNGVIMPNAVAHIGDGWFVTAHHTRPRRGNQFMDYLGNRYSTVLDLSSDQWPAPPLVQKWQVPHPTGQTATIKEPLDFCVFRLRGSFTHLPTYPIIEGLKIGDEILVYGAINRGFKSWGIAKNTVHDIGFSRFSFLQSSGAYTASGDSGGPTFVMRDGVLHVAGVHKGAGSDINLSDKAVKGVMASAMGEPLPTPEPESEPEDIIVKIKPGQRVIVEGVE